MSIATPPPKRGYLSKFQAPYDPELTFDFVPMKLRVEMLKIAPDAAKRMIERWIPDGQRNSTDSAVKRYAADLTDRRWNSQAGTTISIDRNGYVIDGRHRLQAIVDSGVPMDVLVVFECDPSAISVIDIGVPRRLREMLVVRSRGAFKNSLRISGIARSALFGVNSKAAAYSHNYIVEFIEKNQGVFQSFSTLAERNGARKTCHAPVIGAFVRAAFAIGVSKVERLFERFVEQEWEGRNDPLKLLEFYLRANTGSERAKKNVASQRDKYGAAVRAIVASINGENLRKLIPAKADAFSIPAKYLP
jgi:hypothetical protein